MRFIKFTPLLLMVLVGLSCSKTADITPDSVVGTYKGNYTISKTSGKAECAVAKGSDDKTLLLTFKLDAGTPGTPIDIAFDKGNLLKEETDNSTLSEQTERLSGTISSSKLTLTYTNRYRSRSSSTATWTAWTEENGSFDLAK